MNNLIKKILNLFIPHVVLTSLNSKRQKKIIYEWEKKGYPVPTPHLVKQETISEYQKKFGYTTLIETGTFMGDMVDAQKTRFKNIISIELGVDLFH